MVLFLTWPNPTLMSLFQGKWASFNPFLSCTTQTQWVHVDNARDLKSQMFLASAYRFEDAMFLGSIQKRFLL